AGFGSSGVHLVAFHELPPSFAHGMHFSPCGQSWSHTEHSIPTPPPPSGSLMKPWETPPPLVSPDPLSGSSVSPSPVSAESALAWVGSLEAESVPSVPAVADPDPTVVAVPPSESSVQAASASPAKTVNKTLIRIVRPF